MANTIDSRIVISAEDRASAVIKGMARDLEHLSGTVRRAASLLTSLAGIGGLVAFMRENLQATEKWKDEMAKLDLATKRFFQTAASTGALDALVGIVKFTTEAAVGLSTAFGKLLEGVAALGQASKLAVTGEFGAARDTLVAWKRSVDDADAAYQKFREELWRPAPAGFAEAQARQLAEAQAAMKAAAFGGTWGSPEMQEQLQAQEMARNIKFQTDLSRLVDRETKRRAQFERTAEASVQQAKMQTWQLAAGLVRAMAGDSRAAAIAVLAIEKGLAAAGVITNTEAAIARAEFELGPYAAAPYIAKLRTQEKISLALIAATGLAEAANVGGGGAEAGSPANPISTLPTTQPIGGVPAGPSVSQPEIVVIIQGNVVGQEQYIRDTLIPGIREELRRDAVLVPSGSLQAEMLRA